MKQIIFTILILFGVTTSFAQVPTQMYEKGQAFEKHPKFKVSQNNSPEKKMPVFDLAPLLAEDEAAKGLDVPFRFGKSFDVDLTLKDGKWVKTDSSEVWILQITSPNAYSLNFIFSELYLPEGAELYIFNDEGSMVYGPVTSSQNQHGKTYLTDIIQGESSIIQLSIPITYKEKPNLTIQKVVHGYKNLFPDYNLESYGVSGDCVIDEDIVCYPAWSEESDGVVQILLSSGTDLCSGSLLNNTNQDYRPFILTAFHCIDENLNGTLSAGEISIAEEWLVRFRFRHTTCKGSTIANGVTYDDTQFRAAWQPTDFALVELQDNIINDIYSIGQKVWLGWDRTGNTPSTVTCIHHPSGDVMKYTNDSESPSITNYGGTNNSHWLVDDWDIGNTEGGSSGSPLFDQNKRVIGQDHAGDGYPVCHPLKGTYFGRFSLSWTGDSTNTTRLSNWLQPIGAPTATTLNSIRQPTPEYSGIGDALCSSSNFSVTYLAPGYTIHHWNGSNVTFPNGNTSNSVLVAPGSQGGAWVQAVINTGTGLYTMPQESFWIGVPDYTQLGIELQNGYLTACDYTSGTAISLSTTWPGIDAYEWYMPNASNWTIEEEAFSGIDNKYVEIQYWEDPAPSQEDIYIRAHNSCGWSEWQHTIWSVTDNCGGLKMNLSPNPATGETTLTIQSSSKEKKVDILEEWELEVFDQTQALIVKTSKLKGNCTTIQTSGWKDGVYIVRAKIGDKLISEKLMVKH